MVNDATGMTFSLLAEDETTEAAMRVLWRRSTVAVTLANMGDSVLGA